MLYLKQIQWELFRKKMRSVLLVVLFALLVICMSFYIRNIRSTQAALDDLAEKLPVTVRIVSGDGSRQGGLNILESQFLALSSAGVHDVRCTSSAAGAVGEDARAVDPFAGGDTSIAGANCIEATGIAPSSFAFADGYGPSLFSGGPEPVCVVYKGFADEHGLSLGDSVTFPMYKVSRKSNGLSFLPLGDVELKVVGTFDALAASGEPTSMYVPIAWMQEATKNAGVEFTYGTTSATLDDPMRLNAFKASLQEGGFQEIDPEASGQYGGSAVSVDDEQFVRTAEQLLQNLSLFQSFFVPFLLLLAGLAALVIFLVLRSTSRDMAVANSLGVPKRALFAVFFAAVFLLCILSCALASPVLVFAAGLSAGETLAVCGLFLVCAVVGIVPALLSILRFNTLDMLTKVD